jgi:hypothetical protein
MVEKIQDPGSESASKNSSMLTLKTVSKSSGKNNLGCSSLILDPHQDFFFHPVVKKVPDPGFLIPKPDPQHR